MVLHTNLQLWTYNAQVIKTRQQVIELHGFIYVEVQYGPDHGLRTPNEGTNLRYLKKWADVADKICCCHT